MRGEDYKNWTDEDRFIIHHWLVEYHLCDDSRDAEIMRGPRNAFTGLSMYELGERHIWATT